MARTARPVTGEVLRRTGPGRWRRRVPVAEDPGQQLRRCGRGDGVHLGPVLAAGAGARPSAGSGRRRQLARRRRRRRSRRRPARPAPGASSASAGPVEAAVHELEQLHGELDVADAAAAPASPRGAEPSAGDLGLGPAFMVRSDRRSSALNGRAQRPRRRPRRRRRPARHRRRPRAFSSAWNSHGSPIAPSTPRRSRGSARADRPALGPQVGVHPEARPGDVEHARARAASSLGAGRLAHEHHVDVAGVVQLVARRACPCR